MIMQTSKMLEIKVTAASLQNGTLWTELYLLKEKKVRI